MISNYLQVHLIASDFLYLYQLGGIKQCASTDVDVFLTHLVQVGWAKGLRTSVLAFDIVQFFPSLNHQLLPMTMTVRT